MIVSIDIETDGPIPVRNSMLSLGAVAFDDDGVEVDSFYRTILPLEGATQDLDTMKWWASKPELWEAATRAARPAHVVMPEYANWYLHWDKSIMLAAPVGFDFTFLRWYLCAYVGADRRWHNCIDLRSVMMESRGRYHGNYKKGLKIPVKHTHIAVEDAREQGLIYFAWRNRKGIA